MKQFNKTILDIIGNTPIIKLQKVAKHVSSDIYVKLEYLNPGGSIKDRLGYYLCQKAWERGELKEGGIIVEATSGNTGVGIAMFAAVHNCHCIFVMADKQSQEKINALKAFGAKVVICPTNVDPEDPRSYYSVAKKLYQSLPNAFYANQYNNPDNFENHYQTTGPEIFQQTGGDFDIFMAGVGTGGTISGVSAFLKTKMPQLKTVGIDIEGSIIAHYHRTGEIIPAQPYVLEGLGEDFLPENIHFDVIDDFEIVKDEESFQMTRQLLKQEGIYCGGSCGAAVLGAIRHAEKLSEAKRILVILPDSGSRYISKIFNDQWMKSHQYHIEESHPQLTQDIANLVSEGVKIV